MQTQITQKRNSAANQDIVTKIITKFPIEYAQKIRGHETLIISKVNEYLRILNVKVRIGYLTKADSQAARAAVIIEHLLREGVIQTAHDNNNDEKNSLSTVMIPINTLGNLIGMKPKDINMVGHAAKTYLDEVTRPQRIEKNKILNAKYGIRGTIDNQVGKLSPIHDTTSDIYIKPQYSHKLAIKLQYRLHNPDEYAQRSEELFTILTKYMINTHKTMRNKLAVSADLKNNAKIYEAACFYIAVKEMDGKTPTVNNIDTLVDDDGLDGDISNLSCDDIITSLRLHPSTFMEILKNVIEHVKNIPQRVKTLQRNRTNVDREDDEKTKKANTDQTSEKLERSQGLLVDDLKVGDESSRDVSALINNIRQDSSKSVNEENQFRQWRSQTLATTLMNKRKILAEELDVPICKVSKQQALGRAVDDIFIKHKITH